MYFNHQLHYSVSSTASSMREIVFLDLFYFHSIENSVDNFVGTERDRKRKHIKTKAVLRRFSDSLANFLLEWGQPRISFCPLFFLRLSFYFVFVKSCKILTNVRWIFKRTRQITCSRMELQRDMEEKYKRSILIRLDSTPNPGTLSCKGKEEGGERRRVT